jgi:hypothetical protein
MSSIEAVTAYGRSPAPGRAVVGATALVVGSLLGFALQGAFDRAAIASATTIRHGAGSAVSSTVIAARDRGVADNNMSDAARLATYCDHQ